MKITGGKTQINLFDFLGLVFIVALLISMCWEAAYRSRYEKEAAPLKKELAVIKPQVNYWKDKYEISQMEVQVCRKTLEEELGWRIKKLDRLDEYLKEHKRARRYFK